MYVPILCLYRFETGFVSCCNHLVKIGLEERDKRVKEVEDFRAVHKEACRSSQETSVKRVKAFEELKQQVLYQQCAHVCALYNSACPV